MLDVKCWVLSVEWAMRHENISPTDATDRHRNHAGCFYQKTRIAPMRTDGSFHGFFTLAPLPTAWFCCAAGATDCHGFFRRRRVVWENVTRWACLVCEKSVEICGICGRQLSAQCAKEQAGCFYSPTDLSDKHRCHADCLSITQIAPSARQIDTDFSHAENLSMRARFNGYAPRGQKFIAQGKRSDALGIMCCVACSLM